ncbi:ribbon-helix-helix protein, CopG family [bacterium]|nr:ribbon-helix-helix protein, CopG family [bacterium]
MSYFVKIAKNRTFSIRITEKQYQGLLEKAKSQDRSAGDVIRKAIDEYLEPMDSNTLKGKQIELYDHLTKAQDTMVEKLEKIVELLSAIGNLPSSKRASR